MPFDEGLLDGPPTIMLIFMGVIACVVVGGFATVIIAGLRQWRANSAAPLRSVDALVVTKRKHTRGVGNDARSSAYFVTFEDQTGARIELPLTGQDYGQLAEGDRGHLIHQGTRFKGFTRNPALES